MSGEVEPWIPPGQSSLIGKKFGLITFAFTFLMMGAMTLWEADRSGFTEGVMLGLVLIGIGIAMLALREIYLAKSIPLPVVTGEEIEDTHALIKRYAGYTKSIVLRLANATDDETVKKALLAIGDIAAELEV